jgi:hypothetical protein
MKLIEDVNRLSLQKYALDQVCSHQNQSLIALAELRSHGITEEQMVSLSNFLEQIG